MMHPHVKTALYTFGVVMLCNYVASRGLPGLAARAGLIPRPAWPAYQSYLPEPLGQIPLLGPGFSPLPYGFKLWYGPATPAVGTTSSSTTPATNAPE